MKTTAQTKLKSAACAERAASRHRALLSTALVLAGVMIAGVTLEREKQLQELQPLEVQR